MPDETPPEESHDFSRAEDVKSNHDDPPALQRCSPAAKRVHDELREADDTLSRKTLETRTRHAESTTRAALNELREAGLAERCVVWPVPKYGLPDDN